MALLLDGYQSCMNDETTSLPAPEVIDMTAGFDLEQVEHPYAVAEFVLAAA